MTEETQWLSQTVRVYKAAKGSCQIPIKADLVKALGIEPGLLVEVRVRNTNIMASPDLRKKGNSKVGNTPEAAPSSEEKEVESDNNEG